MIVVSGLAGCDAFGASVASTLGGPTTARCSPLYAEAAAAREPGRVSRVLSLPVAAVRGIWRRCTPDECNVGMPRPLAMIKSFIPQRRPLTRLGNNECSAGIYKVERQPKAEQRSLKLFPLPVKEECAVGEDAFAYM